MSSFSPAAITRFEGHSPRLVYKKEGCGGECGCEDCKPKNALLALTHPAAWLGLLAASRRPLPLENYRAITYDPGDGVRSVRSFLGIVRVVQARGGVSPRQRSLLHAIHRQTLIRREIVDSRNDLRGMVGLRRDGTWITALDTDGDGIADVMHLVTRDGLGHIFANDRGRDALRDWMELGRNPFCIPGLNLSEIGRGLGIPGCPSGNRRGSTLNPAAAPGVTSEGVPGASPVDLFCRDVAEGGPPPELAGAGQRALSPAPVPKVRLTGRRNFPSQPFTDAYTENVDRQRWGGPMYMPYDEDPAERMQVEEDQPLRMPPVEEKLPPDVTIEVEVGPIKIYNYHSIDPSRNQNAERGAQSRPMDSGEWLGSLSRLCEHWRSSSGNSSLVTQMREALSNTCTDPAGNPDPEGRIGSTCAGLRIERIDDLFEVVGGGDCAEYEGADCEPTSIRDRLNAQVRNWSALEGLEIVEACNPVICQPGFASTLERRRL